MNHLKSFSENGALIALDNLQICEIILKFHYVFQKVQIPERKRWR